MSDARDTGPQDEGETREASRVSAGRAATWLLVGVGAAGMVFAAAFWALETAGVETEIPYVLVGIAGLVLYNLGRLPYYVRLLFPRAEPGRGGPKFHRRD